MNDRERVRERLAELEQEVAALRRRLESAPAPGEAAAAAAEGTEGVEGSVGSTGIGEPAEAGSGTRGDPPAGVRPLPVERDDHAR